MPGLSAVSYDLHAQLAKDHCGDKWGYRAVDTLVRQIYPSVESMLISLVDH